MAGEWREVTVEEIKAESENALATGPFGSSIGSRFFTDSGVPVIRGGNLSEDIGTRLNDEGLVFLYPDKAREFSSSTVHDGDLVFTCWGTVNQVGLVDRRAAHREYIISNKQMKLTPDTAKADSLFLYYLFSSPGLQHRIKNQSIGSSVPGFNLGQLRAMRIRVPEVKEQRAIAHILGTLDDKIELNRRMSDTLEAMAQAIFKSWFVDFQPVRAKAQGRDLGLPKEIADLFPDRFEDSELGEIPAGWGVSTLGDALSVLETGGRPKGGVRDIAEGAPSVGAESIVRLGRFDYSKTKFVPREFFDSMRKGHVHDGDVLLYKDGGRPGEFEPHVTVVGDGFPFYEFCINEHVYRLRSEPGLPQAYLYFWLSSDSVMEEMRNRGTGVAIPGLNSTAVRALSVLRPSSGVLGAFASNVQPMVRAVFARCNASRTLGALRDTLLPKLICGELRVKDAERVTEVA